MRILVVNNIYTPFQAGGAELIVAWLSEGLAQRGHEVTVVSTCAPEAEPYPPEHRNGVTVRRFFPPNLYWSFSRDPQPGLRKAVWHARDAWNRKAGARFAALLKDLAPDVMHTHLIDGMSATVWQQARAAGVPVVHTAHDYHLLCPRAMLLQRNGSVCADPQLLCRAYRAWHLRTARLVDVFASPSRFLLERHREAGLNVARQVVVPNGVPEPAEAALVRGHRDGMARSRFLMLTRLTEEKGIRVLLQAISLLPHDLPIEVMIAGKGPLEDEVRAAAARDARIVPLGYLQGEAKTAALARAGYLLLPSLWYENAPVALVEAAAYGLGVIASRIGGIPEFVPEGPSGILFPPGDAVALADIMHRVATGRDQLPGPDDIGIAAHHTVDAMVDAYEGEYEALLGRVPERARVPDRQYA